MECVLHKQALHTIQAQKYGKGKSMDESAMFGQLAVCFTRCVHCTLLLEQKIFQAFTEKSLSAIMILFLATIHKNWVN